jgi:hypothetical protein
VVITESTARKYFKNKDPLGKILKIDGEKSVRALKAPKPGKVWCCFSFQSPSLSWSVPS